MPETIDVAWVKTPRVSSLFAVQMAEQLRDMEYFGCAGRVFCYAPGRQYKDFLEGSDSEWLWSVGINVLDLAKGHPMEMWNRAFDSGADWFVNRDGGSALVRRQIVKDIVRTGR